MSDEKRDVIDFCKMCSVFKNGKCKGVNSPKSMKFCLEEI